MPIRLERMWAGSAHPDWKLTVTTPDAPPASASGSFAAATEAELVSACLAGRREAFDVIVERHQRDVYRLCYRFTSNHEDASDLAQDVFVRAYRGLRNFKGRSSLATWFYRIGVNVCLNRVTAKTLPTEPLDPERHVDAHGEDPAAALLREERAVRVRAAIARLPRKQRATLVLRIYHELPHEEIARILGSSVGSAKANLFHALGNLKKILGAASEPSTRRGVRLPPSHDASADSP